MSQTCPLWSRHSPHLQSGAIVHYLRWRRLLEVRRRLLLLLLLVLVRRGGVLVQRGGRLLQEGGRLRLLPAEALLLGVQGLRVVLHVLLLLLLGVRPHLRGVLVGALQLLRGRA